MVAPWLTIRTQPTALTPARPGTWLIPSPGRSSAVANLQRQGYEPMFPMLYRFTKRRGQWVRIEEVCFPRYVFFSPGSPRQRPCDGAQYVIGVASLVSFGQKPATIGDGGAQCAPGDGARGQCSNDDAPVHPFSVGMLYIDTGPLSGLVGIVAAGGIERVGVMLSLLGREKQVECPADALSLVA